MLILFIMKSLFKKKEELSKKEAEKPEESKVNAAQLRVAKDLADLSLDSSVTLKKIDPKSNMDLMITITITEDLSFWKGGSYEFSISFGPEYPHKPPNCKCLTKIFHPNIELATGNVCLNILRKDWTPVLSLNGVILGLQFLFYEPEPADPLNQEASKMMRDNVDDFKKYVIKTLKGGSYYGESFKKFI